MISAETAILFDQGRVLEVAGTVAMQAVITQFGDAAHPTHPLALLLEIDGAALPILADGRRADLADRGAPRCGFDVALPPLVRDRPHLLRIRRAVDGAELAGSPVLLPAISPPGRVTGGAALLLAKAARRGVCSRRRTGLGAASR